MRSVTNSMGQVVKGMDKAMESMNLERISLVMDKFESQFADLDVQTSYMESTMSDTTALTTPQDQVDQLINQVRCPESIASKIELTRRWRMRLGWRYNRDWARSRCPKRHRRRHRPRRR